MPSLISTHSRGSTMHRGRQSRRPLKLAFQICSNFSKFGICPFHLKFGAYPVSSVFTFMLPFSSNTFSRVLPLAQRGSPLTTLDHLDLLTPCFAHLTSITLQWMTYWASLHILDNTYTSLDINQAATMTCGSFFDINTILPLTSMTTHFQQSLFSIYFIAGLKIKSREREKGFKIYFN